MNPYGFVRVAAAIPVVEVADCSTNAARIIALIQKADKAGVEAVCFPELSITSYTCGDLFQNTLLLRQAEVALTTIAAATAQLSLVAIVGLPIADGNRLYNCAAVLHGGRILGLVPKTFRPNYGEFYEHRWFASSMQADMNEIVLCGRSVPFGANLVFCTADWSFAIEICEDLWTPIAPSCNQALAGAEVIFNLSASNEIVGKNNYRRQLVAQQSARCLCGYVYASAGFGESSTDLLFAGSAFVAENGAVLAESERFNLNEQLIISEIDIECLRHDRCRNNTFTDSTVAVKNAAFRKIDCSHIAVHTPFNLTRSINAAPFVPTGTTLDMHCREITDIQANALAVRLKHTGIKSVVVGISGGLDSTLALLVCVQAFDRLKLSRKQIWGITMPGFGTTQRTKSNAEVLMEELGVTVRTIDIQAACLQHFEDIGHRRELRDITYENTQARERTQILMDVANQCGALVIGTGDMSELALGWATYNGDHMSMYAVNTGVPKTLVRHLVRWSAENIYSGKARQVLMDIIATPISPELLPADQNDAITQKTEDLVGPYALHDFFLYYLLRFGFAPDKISWLAEQAFAKKYSKKVINKWLRVFLRRFFAQQFKRSCMPDGPKVGSVNLSPRGDWRMPSDASAAAWLADLD